MSNIYRQRELADGGRHDFVVGRLLVVEAVVGDVERVAGSLN